MPPASVAEPDLDRRAQHPVRRLAEDLAPADLHAVRHRRADRRERHEIADLHVEGAAPHLQRLHRRPRRRRRVAPASRPGAGAAPAPLRRPLLRRGSPTRSTSSTARPRSFISSASASASSPTAASSLSHESTIVHQNCSRKRMSFVNISRRSSMPWRARGKRSVPKPKAKPLQSSGSRPQLRKHVRVHHAAPAELEPRSVGTLDVVLRRWLGEREVRRPQPRAELPPEVRLGELVDRAREVAERDAAVDDEPFDLVEHRHVGGIGRVAPEHGARHDRVDRRWLRLHHADLHGRRVRAQHDAAWLAEVDEQRVPHAPRGMLRRHVERGEVVPVAFDLGTFADGEAEADEHVLEVVVRLGDEVQVATLGSREHFGQIESLARDPLVAGQHLDRSAALRERLGDSGRGVVERLPGRLAFVGPERRPGGS